MREDIYLCDEARPDTAFTDESQDRLFELEDKSWWFQYRGRVILSLMNHFFSKDELTLDIGGGNGYTSSFVARSGYNVGVVEPSFSACRNAKKRGLDPVLCGAVTEDSVLDDGMGQALMLDCLEHIEHDDDMLRLLGEKIKKGGTLLITVPAFMSLWSSEDESAGHYRRYRREELENKVSAAGFEVLQSSYFMSFLYLPIFIVRVWMERLGIIKKKADRSQEERKKIAQKQFVSQGKLTNSVLYWLENRELRRLENARKIPFGSSIILVAKNAKS